MDSRILEGSAEAGTDNLDKYYDDYEEWHGLVGSSRTEVFNTIGS
jgi:hypothetical protein